MEINKTKMSSNKFNMLSNNFKEVIFSFLERHEQRKIYWINKKLRPLLADSSYINIELRKKSSSHQLDLDFWALIELRDGTVPCWTSGGIQLFENIESSFKLIKKFSYKTTYWTYPIQQENQNIIFTDGAYEVAMYNKEFKLIKSYFETNFIIALCNLSELSFALGLANGTIKIYSLDQTNQKYGVKEHKYHTETVYSLLYLPNQNYLISSSKDRTIKVFSLSEAKVVQTITDHCEYVTSLISLNETTFASGSYGEIKVWHIKADNINCIKTLEAHEESLHGIDLNLLGGDFMVSRTYLDDEYKIWDLKTYKCLKTYKEDSQIERLICTKNKEIITATDDNQLNIWKILI
jgi:WD40 repeat protein